MVPYNTISRVLRFHLNFWHLNFLDFFPWFWKFPPKLSDAQTGLENCLERDCRFYYRILLLETSFRDYITPKSHKFERILITSALHSKFAMFRALVLIRWIRKPFAMPTQACKKTPFYKPMVSQGPLLPTTKAGRCSQPHTCTIVTKRSHLEIHESLSMNNVVNLYEVYLYCSSRLKSQYTTTLICCGALHCFAIFYVGIHIYHSLQTWRLGVYTMNIPTMKCSLE